MEEMKTNLSFGFLSALIMLILQTYGYYHYVELASSGMQRFFNSLLAATLFFIGWWLLFSVIIGTIRFVVCLIANILKKVKEQS